MPTVIVVDDDGDTSRNLADLVGDLGYVIDTAEGGHEHRMASDTCFSPWLPGQRSPWSSAERTEKQRLVQATVPWGATTPDSADPVQLRCFQPGDGGGAVCKQVRREEAQPAVGWETGPCRFVR
jgi:hypothetical protein